MFWYTSFDVINHEVIGPIKLNVDRVWSLACLDYSINYKFNPIKIAKISFLGTYNMLRLARKDGEPILLASTSEVYGNPGGILNMKNLTAI